MAISIVSSDHTRVVNNRLATVDLTSVQDDDLILFFGFSDDDTAGHTWPISATEIESLQDATGQDTTIGFAFKKASSEPATAQVDFIDATTIINTAAVIILRGQDLTTAFDVVYVRANHLTKHINTTSPQADTITTLNDNALVLCIHFTPAGGITDMVVPSSGATWTERETNDELGSSFNICTAPIGTAGLVTPGSSSHVGLGATDETVTVVLAIRAAAAAGGAPASVIDPFYRNLLAGNQYV